MQDTIHRYKRNTFFLFLLIMFCGDLKSQEVKFSVSQIGANRFLKTAWDLNYGPDDYLWITEREEGVVVRVNPENGERDDLIKIDEVYSDSRQDGLLGMAIDNNLDVFLSYTYRVDGQRKQKIVRYTYVTEVGGGSLVAPVLVIDGLPASNDHNSGRLILGPDDKLYYTIGDQGGNQNSNYCNPILSQTLPTAEEIAGEDWSNYPGKILRLEKDGSIPEDNPILDGVRSHIYTYGHRNAQGIVFGNNGLLYSDEHGPDTDDEVNLISAGMNYGWPRVVGFQDDQAYDFCNWSSLEDCSAVDYEKLVCPDGAIFLEENSLIVDNYMEPIFSMFAVTDDYDYNNPICENAWICRPNVAPSSLEFYGNESIPSWGNSLLVASLKRGKVYRIELDENGTAIEGDTTELFYTQNRYRDIVAHPNGKSFFVITDASGNTSGPQGLTVKSTLNNPGTILKFTLEEPVAVLEAELLKLNFWPNPAEGRISIDLPLGIESDVSGFIVDVDGKLVKTFEELHAGINELNIDDIPGGMHFIKIYLGKKVIISKFVKF